MAMSTKEYALLCKAAGQKLPSIKTQLDSLDSVLTSANQSANVALLDLTASEDFDSSELQAVADKVDALIGALITAGLMAEAE